MPFGVKDVLKQPCMKSTSIFLNMVSYYPYDDFTSPENDLFARKWHDIPLTGYERYLERIASSFKQVKARS